MKPGPDDPVLPFADAAAFEKWLAKNHKTATVLWIKHAKKDSGLPTITWTEAVDVALCYGWIDGQSRSLDATHYIQRYTPRRAKSMWSKINRERVARLITDGRMKPAGLAEVDRAKADGRWDGAYDSPKTSTVPPDLAAALAKNKKARLAFEALSKSNRYMILHRVQTAKKPETRAKRIAAFVATLASGTLAVPPPPSAKIAKR